MKKQIFAKERLINKIKIEQKNILEQIESREVEINFLKHKLKINLDFLEKNKNKGR